MKPTPRLAPLILALGLLASSAHASENEPVLSVFSGVGGRVWLSDARTYAGLGGSLGVRDTLSNRFILQADASFLTLLGNVLALRVGAGIQRQGLWTPAALVTLTGLFGDHLSFSTPAHPAPVAAPPLAIGLVLAPLRFTLGGTQVSLLQVEAGLGTDFPGRGLTVHVEFVEAGFSL